MPRKSTVHAVTTIGIDMGKNTLHMVGLEFARRHRVAREGLAGTHYIEACERATLSNWHRSGDGNTLRCSRACGARPRVKQVPPTYAKPFRQGHKNDFRDAHAVAEAVQRPTTRFVPAKTDEQLDLQALHRVRSRLVSERTAVINQIRGFLRHSVEAGEPGRSTASRFGSLAPLSACILPCWLQHSPTCKRSSSPREWLTAQANPESKSWLSAEVCSRKEEMERRSRQRVRDRNPYGLWGRDANEIERARYPCWPGAQMLHQ